MALMSQPELFVLLLTLLLGFLHLIVATGLVTHDRGLAWNLSPRDRSDLAPPLSKLSARADRALQNFKETFPLFVAAVVLVQFYQATGNLSYWGAWIYFAARVIYFPLYLAGIPVLRTLVWTTSIVGIAMIVASVFPL